MGGCWLCSLLWVVPDGCTYCTAAKHLHPFSATKMRSCWRLHPASPCPCVQPQQRAFTIRASCTPSQGHTLLLLVTIPVVQVLTGCGQQLQHRRCWPSVAASLGCVPSPGATCPQPSPQGEGHPLTPAPSQPC